MTESWIEIPEFTNYEVSDLGNVRNKKSGRHLKQFSPKGYQRVTIYKNGIGYKKFVHRLVVESFIGLSNDSSKTQVNHIDENKKNNSLKNLEWLTPKENTNHATGIARRKLAQRNQRSTSLPVVQMTLSGVELHSFESMKEAERKTGISVQQISMCCSGKITRAGKYKFKKIERE